MRKILLALGALALAAALGYSVGKQDQKSLVGTAWAQRFLQRPSVGGKVLIEDVVLEGVVGVSGLEESCEVLEVRDPLTGELKFIPGPRTYKNLQLSLVAGKSTPDLMVKWFDDSIVEGRLEKKTGAVVLYDLETGDDLLRYEFFEAWPCKWYVPEIDRSSGLAIEKIEIAVEKVERAR